MDIQEATSIIKCIPAIYRHRGYYDKDGKWIEGEGNSYTVIKDINNLKRELKRDGLYSDRMDEFLESYMNYYNN